MHTSVFNSRWHFCCIWETSHSKWNKSVTKSHDSFELNVYQLGPRRKNKLRTALLGNHSWFTTPLMRAQHCKIQWEACVWTLHRNLLWTDQTALKTRPCNTNHAVVAEIVKCYYIINFRDCTAFWERNSAIDSQAFHTSVFQHFKAPKWSNLNVMFNGKTTVNSPLFIANRHVCVPLHPKLIICNIS